jgi:hypothetical protein
MPVRKDRNSHGGGIIMYHKNNINILRSVDLEHEHVESMWFELKTKVHPILPFTTTISFTVVGRFIIKFLFKSPRQIIWLFS